MSIVESTCLELSNLLNIKTNKEDIYNTCVINKLIYLYTSQSNDVDILMNSLIADFDNSNINDMCSTLKQLNRCLRGNREQLLGILERMCN